MTGIFKLGFTVRLLVSPLQMQLSSRENERDHVGIQATVHIAGVSVSRVSMTGQGISLIWEVSGVLVWFFLFSSMTEVSRGYFLFLIPIFSIDSF
jgi:hypothetical protein